MKAYKLSFLYLNVLYIVLRAQGQGTFQNLGFESAVLIPVPSDPFGSVLFAPAFPGWTGYYGTEQWTIALNNNVSLAGLTGMAIMGPNYPAPNYFQGQFFVQLQAGLTSLPSGPFVTAALEQTGQIPVSARSLQFLSTAHLQTGQMSVFFGGSALNLVPLAGGPNSSTLYGADISGLAGTTGVLRFQANSGNPNLDDIQFSTQVIPEPSALGLFGFGALFLGYRSRRTVGM